MKKWILSLILLLPCLYASAGNNQIKCQKAGTQNIRECTLSTKNNHADQVYGINNMPYALCSQTACTPTSNKDFAHCQCELENHKEGWKSFSLSPTNYESAKPTFNTKGHLQTVQSNYSMANIKNFKKSANQSCQYDKPHAWANCYGVRCEVKEKTIDGNNQKIALCRCPVERSKTFLIGSQKQSACHKNESKIIWSGTTGASFKAYGANPMVILYQKVYPQSPPVKNQKN